MLEANNISFRYERSKWILQNVNITVRSGEVIGLFGPSGYGKTTLARLLAGYLKPEVGKITIHNSRIRTGHIHPVQLIWQHPEKAVNPKWRMEKTIQEGWNPDEKTRQQLGIKDEWLTRWPNELSGGELQRICVARALSPDVRFLLADEMTSMLDAITQAHIWQVIVGRVKNDELGVLAISHDLDLLEKISTHIIDIRNLHTK